MKSGRLAIAAALIATLCVTGVSIAQSGGTPTAHVAKTKKGPPGPRGPQGPQGPAGPAGAPGLQGPAGVIKPTITVVVSGTVTNGNFSDAVANCPAGYQAVGGGVDPNGIFYVTVTASSPAYNGQRLLNQADGQHGAANGWFGAVAIRDTQSSAQFKVAAICSRLS